MKIQDIIDSLEKMAPLFLQEDYDNSGLITGNPQETCTGIMISLDATPEVIDDAISNNCNLLVSHHPILFRGLKKITGKNYVEEAIIKAIKAGLSIYAIHTNLDNVINGVNGKIADILELSNRQILIPKEGNLYKLVVYVPIAYLEQVRSAVFAAGAGEIGNYSECSFATEGSGTFKANDGAKPFIGEIGLRHQESECRFEVILPYWLKSKALNAMQLAHPYEEVAYDLIPLANPNQTVGSGIIGTLPEVLSAEDLLQKLADLFKIPCIRHTVTTNRKIEKVAVCGGAGSFLIPNAIAMAADAFITADLKYHEFFDAEGRMLLADIGHFESEQFTIDLLAEFLSQNFPNFAVLKTGVHTNPVRYFVAQ